MPAGMGSCFLPTGGASAAFAPTDVAGLHGWWRMDTGTVSSITDKSGNGRHFVQATGGNQGVLSTSANFNGQSILTLDGVNDYYTCTTALTTSAFTIYIVARRIGAADSSDGILSFGSSTGGGNDYDTNNGLFCGDTTLNSHVNLYRANVEALSVTPPGTNVLYGYEAVVNGAQYDLRVNAATNANASGPNGALGTGATAMGCRILAGVPYTAAACPNYEIAEIAVYDTALSSGNRTSMRAYLTARYALTGF